MEKFTNIAKSNSVVPEHKLKFLWDSVCECPPGDIVEVGCWRGGTSLILSASAREFKPESRVYLCDTFKGIVLAGPNDNTHKDGNFSNTSKQHVQDLLTKQGLTNFTLLEGTFPHDTGHLVETKTISLLHIDVDVYEGYLAILRWAQPYLVDGAIIVFDDYSAPTCLGATKAVDEYFADRADFEMHLWPDETRSSWTKYRAIS